MCIAGLGIRWFPRSLPGAQAKYGKIKEYTVDHMRDPRNVNVTIITPPQD